MRLGLVLVGITLALVPAQAATPKLQRGVAVHLAFDGIRFNLEQEVSEARHVAHAGFDFVRLTVDPYFYLHLSDERKIDKMNASVLAAVHAYETQGLRVVIDFHAIPKGQNREMGSGEYAADAAQFANYTSSAANLAEAIEKDGIAQRAFEPFNEPTLDCVTLSLRWPALALKLHAQVRKAAPKLTLVMEGGCWGGAEGLVALSPDAFHDPNIIWSFHDYAPMLFTHQGAGWVAGPPHYAVGLPFPPNTQAREAALIESLLKLGQSNHSPEQQSTKENEQRQAINDYFAPGKVNAEMRGPFTKVAHWAHTHHLPPDKILLGEFGVIQGTSGAQPDIKSRSAYLRNQRMAVEGQGWAWAVWEWHGSFGINAPGTEMLMDPVLGTALGLPAKH